MTEPPDFTHAVFREGDSAKPWEAGDPVTVVKLGAMVPFSCSVLYPEPPSPEQQAALEERRAIATRDMPAALHRLDHLDDPVSRAVLDLHARRPGQNGWDQSTSWECTVCLDGEDASDWPCSTVDVVAKVHGIDLDGFWWLDRPTDGSLDDQRPEEPTP